MSTLPGTVPPGSPTGELWSVPAIAGSVRAGRRTAAEIAEELLTRIDTGRGALLTVDPDPVRAAAAALDRRTDRFALALAGVPVAVEDGISLTGRGDEPVRRLRGAGALVAGRAHTAEFGIGPDGSPGGRATAAAVAAAAVPLGIGIDGDGALRAAAAAHGLTALKPGRRVLPLPMGADRRWSGLAETTVVAATPQEVRAALDVLTAPAPRAGGLPGAVPDGAAGRSDDSPLTTLACSLRIGRSRLATHGTGAAVHTAIRLLEAAGLRLFATDPPYRASLPVHAARRRQAGLARRVEDLDLDPEALPGEARATLRRGRRVRRLGGLRPATPASWRQRVVAWLDETGTEAALLPAPGGPAAGGSTGLTAWNLAGLPSLVTPAGDGRCVQLVGRPGSERRLLATATLLSG